MKDFLIQKRLAELTAKGRLTNEQIDDLFKEYEEDKINNVPIEDSCARTILILYNMRLVYYIIKTKFGIEQFDDSSDEVSVGKTGLVKAIDSFKLGNNINFSTYATRVIRNEILMYYRKLNTRSSTAHRTAISLEDYCENKDNEVSNLRFCDMLGEEDNHIKEYEDKDFYNSVVKNMVYLTPKEQIVITYYFGLTGGDGMSQRDIAKAVGTSRSYVSRLLKSGLDKLRVLSLSEEELDCEQIILRHSLLKGAQTGQKMSKNG